MSVAKRGKFSNLGPRRIHRLTVVATRLKMADEQQNGQQTQRDTGEGNSRNNFRQKRNTYRAKAAVIAKPVQGLSILMHNGAEIPHPT